MPLSFSLIFAIKLSIVLLLKFYKLPWHISKSIFNFLAKEVILWDDELSSVKNDFIFIPVSGNKLVISPTKLCISWLDDTNNSSGFPFITIYPFFKNTTLLYIYLITSIWCITTLIIIFNNANISWVI